MMKRPDSPGVTTSGPRRAPLHCKQDVPRPREADLGDGGHMAHGDTEDSAAARLGQLHDYFREYPVTQPLEGHATTVEAPAPMSLGTLDHITAAVREVAAHTRAANPDAGPVPDRVADVYAWMREHTAHAPEIEQQRAEVLEYRHWLEHCLSQGDHETVRRQARVHTCPECDCWGLMWERKLGRVVCSNRDCVDREGFSTKLTLARLAYVHVTVEQKLRQARAT